MKNKTKLTQRFGRLLAAGALAATFTAQSVQADAGKMPMFEESPFGLSVSLNSDTFFGFYPAFQGTYALSDWTDFTVYGILWSAGGPGAGWGNWTEVGFGANFQVTDFLSINPQIGFLGGSLLYSGATGPAVINDGIVPNLTLNLATDRWEGQTYMGFYTPVRESPVGTANAQFLHYWSNLGYRLNPYVSVGGHWEQLLGGNSFDQAEVFSWLGPYVQLADPNSGLFVRATGGWDLTARDSFYKVSAGFSF